CGSAPSGATTFQYDPNGNLTGQSDGRVLSYNSKDQTTSFKAGGALSPTTSMSYLGVGQAERTSAGGSSFKNGPLGLAIHSSGLLSTTNYVRDPDGGLVSLRNGSGAYFYLFDRLGSVVALTDASGNPVNRYFYDPYGNYLVGTTEAVANPWQYAGGFKDAFSGYYKFGARYYDPVTGRWTQPDPSGMDANSYAYAGSNPVNFVDSSGLKIVDGIKKAAKKFWRDVSSHTWYEYTAWGLGTFAGFGCWAAVTAGTFATLSGPATVACVAVGSAVTKSVIIVGERRKPQMSDVRDAVVDFTKDAACLRIVGGIYRCPILDAPPLS
ncbi:MAG: RHS repeat-associated core domain-containing protein, partial [Actinomycetota bacterium]